MDIRCRCKMRLSGLSKVEMSGFMGGRGIQEAEDQKLNVKCRARFSTGPLSGRSESKPRPKLGKLILKRENAQIGGTFALFDRSQMDSNWSSVALSWNRGDSRSKSCGKQYKKCDPQS